MAESKDHPDVDELHKRISEVDKKISIATVYRTVKLFEEAGHTKVEMIKDYNKDIRVLKVIKD